MSADYDEFATMVIVTVHADNRGESARVAEQVADLVRTHDTGPGARLVIATSPTHNTKGEGGGGER